MQTLYLSFTPHPFLQLPLSHRSQHHQRRVKLLGSVLVVLEVAMAVSSLLAIVGVIELAVPSGTAVLILVQPAQEQVMLQIGKWIARMGGLCIARKGCIARVPNRCRHFQPC